MLKLININMLDMMNDNKTVEISPHYYLINGIGKFDNMKELRMTLGVSRNAIRMLMKVGIIKKIEIK